MSSLADGPCGEGCSQAARAAPSARGMKRTQIRNCDSVFFFYWFMACGQLAEALLVAPVPSPGHSTRGRPHTWKQRVSETAVGPGG